MTLRALPCLALVAAFVVAAPASAQRGKTKTRAATRTAKMADAFELEVRVIEAEKRGAPYIAPELFPLKNDLKGLPFARFTLRDTHHTFLASGEQMSFEFPEDNARGAKRKKRFLVAKALGERGNKLSFQLSIAALGFDTRVAVKDGGTVFVGGPRTDKKKTLIFAVTAKKRATRANAVPKTTRRKNRR